MAGDGCYLLILASRRSRVGRLWYHVRSRRARRAASLVTFTATTSCHVHALISSRVTSSPRPSPPRTFVERSAVINRHHIATFAHLSPPVPPPLHIRPVTLLAQAVDSFLPPSRFAPYLDACPRFPRSCPRTTLFPRTSIGFRVSWQR